MKQPLVDEPSLWDGPDVVYDGRSVRVTRRGSVTVVESRYPLAWKLVAPVLLLDTVFLIVLCAGWWLRGHLDDSIGVNIAAAVATLAAVGMFGLTLVGTAQAVFARRLSIDMDQKLCRLRHLPGFGRIFRPDEVSAVYVVTFSGSAFVSGHRCDVALGLQGSERLLRIHTHIDSAKVGVQLIPGCQPLANVIAESLNSSVKIEHGAARSRMRWL